MERKSSGWAVGFTMFAAIMLLIAGSFQILAGLAGLFENEFYVRTSNYFLEFDVSAWGWIHLVWGVVVLLAGLGLLQGSLWGRTLGVIGASVSALINFAFIPLLPGLVHPDHRDRRGSDLGSDRTRAGHRVRVASFRGRHRRDRARVCAGDGFHGWMPPRCTMTKGESDEPR